MHPKTTTFATLLASRTLWNESVAVAIDRLFKDYSFERKADLYALVVEGITLDMTFKQMAGVVDRCLQLNDGRYGG
jgi:hypothetical protein